ncbi:MAG: SUMF1/EgtB/PvdO family nonheme iron enzyme, partial [Planctomycetes bacterium]|nr:SUMF1/EgtB/PvdO family nonheme iron enzyme [Planctomycetota bacterium]
MKSTVFAISRDKEPKMRRQAISLTVLAVLVVAGISIYTEWPFDAEEAKRRQQETAKSLDIPVVKKLDLDDGVTMKLVLIPAGEFEMGSNSGDDDEKAVHTVRITKPFYMGVTEVTQEQWQAVMGENRENPSFFYFDGKQNPVETVSWNDLTEFCKKLSQRTGRRVRLPTEAEWEYACRAGNTTAYCFGDSKRQLGDYAWYDDNSNSKTHPVGQKKANDWGLYDMHGNVCEWCRDYYDDDYYENSPESDPTGPNTGSFRVLR